MSHLRIRDDISSFTIFTKPEKKIFVTKDMPKHSLFFLPHSANMDYKKKNLKKEFVVERDWIDSKEKVAGETLWIKPIGSRKPPPRLLKWHSQSLSGQ